MENTYYVKSLDSDNTTKTLEGDKKVVCQNLSDILSSNIIKTNTRSFGQKMRLSTTILHDNYLKTYRPQGVIFKTDNIPDYVLPFDLILLSETDNIVVHYYQMKDNLHQFYNHKLIVGYKQFVFKNIGELVSKFKTPVSAWREVNTFRLKNGQKKLLKSKFRLCEYNEVVFEKSIKIEPVAVFGYRKETREIARKFKLPYFRTARDFYLKT